MDAEPKPWIFGPAPYHKSCGICGVEFLARTVDAGVPEHECKKSSESRWPQATKALRAEVERVDRLAARAKMRFEEPQPSDWVAAQGLVDDVQRVNDLLQAEIERVNRLADATTDHIGEALVEIERLRAELFEQEQHTIRLAAAIRREHIGHGGSLLDCQHALCLALDRPKNS